MVRVDAGSAGTSAPARITTPGWAAHGGNSPRRQRRDLGPGEDHNINGPSEYYAYGGKQRRDFGPGEDHNCICGWNQSGIPAQRWDFGPGEDHNHVVYAAIKEWIGQRRDFGPGEDHNMKASFEYPHETGRQRRDFGPARITTRSARAR